jgi:hypothetical protein
MIVIDEECGKGQKDELNEQKPIDAISEREKISLEEK